MSRLYMKLFEIIVNSFVTFVLHLSPKTRGACLTNVKHNRQNAPKQNCSLTNPKSMIQYKVFGFRAAHKNLPLLIRGRFFCPV